MGKGFKASETLLGIETEWFRGLDCDSVSFKASESLLGIETYLGKVGGVSH